MALDLLDLRLAIYQAFVDEHRALTPVDIADRFGVAPHDAEQSLRRLESEADAIVLLPDSPYIWMAEPFSAIPTSYPVVADDGRRWFGNCIWDGAAILSLVGVDGEVRTRDRHTGEPIVLRVGGGGVEQPEGVVHFAVPAQEWWRSIGFT